MSKKSTDKVAQVEDLKKRLIAMRGGSTQRAFANALGVSQATIATWEKGDERPARERFLDLAKLASTKEERLWFLAEAGVDIGLVKSDLREDAADRMEALDEISREDRDSLAAVPVIQISELLAPKTPASLGEESPEKLYISARHLANAEDVVAFGIPHSTKIQFFPSWLEPHDLILIDRGIQLLRDFFIDEAHNCLHLAAILVPHRALFEHHMTGSLIITGLESEKREIEERRVATAKQPAVPFLMVGHFEEEIAGAEKPRVPSANDLCRLVFVHLHGRLALTDWAKGTRPRDMGPGAKFLHDARIVGAVSGWISSPRAIGLKERMAASARRNGRPLPPGQSLLRPTGR
jgi:transcriptional regulator with XRE-family HTH domain